MRLFPEKIHQIREERNLYQKDLAEALSIDTPAYCRIEKGERRAKREQVITLSVVLATDRKIAKRVLSLAKQSING